MNDAHDVGSSNLPGVRPWVRAAALAAVVGGVGWLAKPLYDRTVLGRLTHTGYPDQDWTDRAAFLVPLLLFFALWVNYRQERRRALAWAAAGLPLIALATFTEAWSYGSEIPTGLLALPGFLLLSIGLMASRQWTRILTGALVLAQPVGSAVIFNTLNDGASATMWELALSGLVGLAWIGMGLQIGRADRR